MSDESSKKEVQKEEVVETPVAEYKLTDEYRPEDQGQKLVKNRVIEKTLPQTYVFSYQDIHTMIATFKKELHGIEMEKKDLDRKAERAMKSLALWEGELKLVNEKFPELVEKQGQPSPIQVKDLEEGADEGDEQTA